MHDYFSKIPYFFPDTYSPPISTLSFGRSLPLLLPALICPGDRLRGGTLTLSLGDVRKDPSSILKVDGYGVPGAEAE